MNLLKTENHSYDSCLDVECQIYSAMMFTIRCSRRTGLCCVIIWTRFSVFENVLNCCHVCYDHDDRSQRKGGQTKGD